MNTTGREDSLSLLEQDLAKATLSSFTSPSPTDPASDATAESSAAESSLLADLPSELVHVILDHVPPEEQQRAALALRRVLPHHPVSSAHLWNHLVVHHPRQLLPLYRKLKEEAGREGGGATTLVKTFAQESWRGDADVMNNVLRWLPDVRTLMLNVGTNFVPEHLQELFHEPRPGIERMEMRFRPYVEQASYYQFLKGSYFDSAVETLRSWPETPSFTHLSLVQDLPPRGTEPPTRNTSEVSLIDDVESLGWQSRYPSRFPSRLGSAVPTAAPSVAASAIESAPASTIASAATSTLTSAAASTASSPASSDTESASEASTPPTSIDEDESPACKEYTRKAPFPFFSERMQKFRPKTFAQPIVFFDIKCIARFGASPAAKHITHFRLHVPSRDIASVLIPAQTRIFPSLRYLDISTTNVRLDAVLSTLLRTHERLEHLVLDRVNLFGFKARESGGPLCKELGTMCVTAGLARGKERERQILAWDAAERTRQAERAAAARRAIHDSDAEDEETREQRRAEQEAQAMRDEMQRQIALARSRRGHRSAGQAPFSLRDRPSRRTAVVPTADLPPSERAYFVLPALPTLKSVSIGGETPNLSRFKASGWEDEFHSGWRAGLATLHGWAVHVAEKYERALKKAEEWRETQARKSASANNMSKGKGKGKAMVAPKITAKPPPLDVRLFRFAAPDEPLPDYDASDPTTGLIELHPESPRDYLDGYKQAIADAELYTHTQAVRPPCVLCTVPEVEGPRRRGADGERIDGRGGMDRDHRPGCGHQVGRAAWGWEGVEARGK
ncbi:hypothetical protein CC85DRAFT_286676 [Cutaneotrichosporon oleaginosum]|uniref:F-box domain-containing protein n=1 Tax=Cutaneotrichosporon oleaginosum TaxID=879819 RepID=A0A0J1B0V5_9TREE|nr:uncharacterized protein CC85DRAFT_286676 [Cutaneotrichosporon oleaginosum]KLT41239.1 hypothetical protein CC85DRAFT_286676 [Cutaneotrichosporon oleaginosum]TXT05502.1 hypothetical protein COLE_06822 [Cutaneotrichosporon oleaginosum]